MGEGGRGPRAKRGPDKLYAQTFPDKFALFTKQIRRTWPRRQGSDDDELIKMIFQDTNNNNNNTLEGKSLGTKKV